MLPRHADIDADPPPGWPAGTALATASSTARVVASMSTTTPFFIPVEGTDAHAGDQDLPVFGQFGDQRADFRRPYVQSRNDVVFRHAPHPLN